MIPTPLPIDPVGFDPATATEEQVRDMLGRCFDRRDLWDGVCVELEEALERRDDADEVPGAGRVHPLDRWQRVLNALDKAVARGDERFVKHLTNIGPPAGLVRVFRLSPISVEWAVRDERGILTGQTFRCRAAQEFTKTGDDHVATDCGHVVTLPYGIERRPATCPNCLAAEP